MKHKFIKHLEELGENVKEDAWKFLGQSVLSRHC